MEQMSIHVPACVQSVRAELQDPRACSGTGLGGEMFAIGAGST